MSIYEEEFQALVGFICEFRVFTVQYYYVILNCDLFFLGRPEIKASVQ